MLLQSPHVALAMDGQAEYPEPPFHPPEQLPEFKDSWLSAGPFDPANRVYRLVREALFRLVGGYDIRTGRVDLDALRVLGQPQNIVVKPNWVRQEDDASRGCIITHASVLRAIIDYLLLAFGEHCKITVGDVPLQSTNIAELWRESGIALLSGYYEANGLAVNFRDWRREKILMDSSGFISNREPLAGDPRGFVTVSLGSDSLLEAITNGESRFSVNDYEPGMAACYHRRGQHGYLVSRTALEADLFINVAKLKTHCKAGMTGCMKNLIGINGEKAWIPHFRRGAPRDGGDEYPNQHRRVMMLRGQVRETLQHTNRRLFASMQVIWQVYKRSVEMTSRNQMTSGGAWPGNDTLWRSVLDLVRIITFADKEGRLCERPQRRQLCFIDGIVAGEGEGPLHASQRRMGLLIASYAPAAADYTACHIMGFDWTRIPQLKNAPPMSSFHEEPAGCPRDLTMSWWGAEETGGGIADLPVMKLIPPAQWKGMVELSQSTDPRPAEQVISQCR